MTYKILDKHNINTGFVTIIAHNRWIQAKVYDDPSDYGVRNCRVSKISIAKEGVRLLGIESGLRFFDNCDYNYDRGLDFHNKNNLSKKTLYEILDYLNDIPQLFEYGEDNA
jgi:hypothetical protein